MAIARRKRSIRIAKHRTSVSLEEPFWDALRAFAKQDGRSVADLVGEIDKGRGEPSNSSADGDVEAERRRGETGLNLSAAIRLYVLERMRRDP
jgi:predicted DNA-binding ribbon-helix-helix protein